MSAQLPEEFDLIIIGTGLIESILSAAASRIGKSVLHIDRNDYYGGQWSSFNLKYIQNLCKKEPFEKSETENTLRLGNDLFDIKDFKVKWHIPEKVDQKITEDGNKNLESKTQKLESEGNGDSHILPADAACPQVTEDNKPETIQKCMEKVDKEIKEDGNENLGSKTEKLQGEGSKDSPVLPVDDASPSVIKNINQETTQKCMETITKPSYSQETLLNDARRFNIDLTPKLHYARGNFVELLISSNIARYAEYRCVSRVQTYRVDGELETVPCARSDVFANNKVSVIEKRMLMKLLTSLDLNEEELKNYESKTFQTFLKDRKLPPNLMHYVLYAISMSDDKTLCKKGIANTKRFLDSSGRFGKTPFLFSMYGSGETTQAFCRLSAVFGGIFALSQPLKGLTVEENKVTHLVTGEQNIKAENFVLSLDKSPEIFVKDLKVEQYISRAVFITDRSLMPSEQEHLSLIIYPPFNGKNLTTIIEMGSLTGTCPKGLFLVHLIAEQQENPEKDFEHIIESLFEEKDNVDSEYPQILWSCYFSIPNTTEIDLRRDSLPKNLFLCSGPDLDLDYDESIKKAKDIFEQIYPDVEFLPRAPDPEEIIIGEDPEPGETVEIIQAVMDTDNKHNIEEHESTENS